MPGSSRKTKANRNQSLKTIQNTASNKAWFRITETRKKYPGQLIRLYSNTLKNDFPGQLLKELNPKEYLKQKQKLQVANNLNTRKHNKPKATRGPGSRGSILRRASESFENYIKRMLGK